MRGERSDREPCPGEDLGSSPHARGTLLQHVGRQPIERFIPACAGNAHQTGGFPAAEPVHPRMRGERSRGDSTGTLIGGSSPHARGTPAGRTCRTSQRRFIPACAGNAASPRPAPRARSVHPRMRGERSSDGFGRDAVDGSSPHARGTRRGVKQDEARHRFIPACAGNALDVLLDPGIHAGSSPHARGTRYAHRSAGCIHAVHPRMRGERIWFWNVSGVSTGSSPHARGTRRPQRCQHADKRFIPACAGNAGRGDLG